LNRLFIMWNLELELKTRPEYNKIESAIDIPNVIEKVFNYKNDKLIITLNETFLYLPLPYVFSDLLDDFLLIINDLLNSEDGNGTYGFSQNNVFDADWILTWKQKKVDINIQWRIYPNNVKQALSTTLSINKVEFLLSWRKIFTYLSEYIDFKHIFLDYDDENLIINRLLSKDIQL